MSNITITIRAEVPDYFTEEFTEAVEESVREVHHRYSSQCASIAPYIRGAGGTPQSFGDITITGGTNA